MSFTDYLKSVNKRVDVSADRWLNLKQYYISMYHFYLLKLYDKGYISDPTRYDEKEIRRNLVDFGISDFVNIYGVVILTSEYVEFVLHRTPLDEDAADYLVLLYYTLKYREYNIELDKQYERSSSGVRLHLGLKDCSRITTLTDVNYNKGVFCLLVKEGYTLERITFRDKIFELAMKELGIPEEDFCDGMFVKGMSLKDEMRYCNLILDGEVRIDGVYADKLMDWLKKYRWKNSEHFMVSNRGLYRYTFSAYGNEVLGIVNSMLDEYGDDLVIIYEDIAYVSKPMEFYNMPISMFVSLTSCVKEDSVVCTFNDLYGYSGEAYTYDYLCEEGLNVVGIPVTVSIDGVETQVFDVDQIATDVKQDSWFSASNSDFEFEEEFYIPNPYKKGTLEHGLFESFLYGNRGEIYRLPIKDGVSMKTIKTARRKVAKEINKTKYY